MLLNIDKQLEKSQIYLIHRVFATRVNESNYRMNPNKHLLIMPWGTHRALLTSDIQT